MASQPPKSSNRIVLIAGALCAALAFGGVLYIARANQGGGGSGGATRQVVVAKADVDAGTSLSADVLKVAALPGDAVPADAFSDPNALAGKVLSGKIAANTPIVPALVQDTAPPAAAASGASPAAGTTTAAQAPLAISKGHVALAIPASAGTTADYTGDLTSVGYYIQPGDHIDILIDPGGSPAGVRYSFQDVVVLRAGAASGGTSGATAPTVYVIELPRAQAEQLTALITHRGPQAVVKYVVRPKDENGKPGAPRYEDSSAAPLPAIQDQTVSLDGLSKLFPR